MSPGQRRGFLYAVASIYDWGCGADGSGQNRYGQVLMAVRTRKQAAAEA